MTIIRRLCFALALVAATHGIAEAQAFDMGQIRVGQTVFVRDLTGAETRGVVQSAEPTRLVVKYGFGRLTDPTDPSRILDDTRTFTPAEVDRVRRPGPIWDGAVKGAFVALIPVALLTGACDCGAPPPSAFAVFMGAGAGIGVVIDAAFGPRNVYRNRGESRKVTVAPVVGGGRRGFAASIRF
jgi:hypothetical protein